MRYKTPHKRTNVFDGAVENGAILIVSVIDGEFQFPKPLCFYHNGLWRGEMVKRSREKPAELTVAIQCIATVIHDTVWTLPGYGIEA